MTPDDDFETHFREEAKSQASHDESTSLPLTPLERLRGLAEAKLSTPAPPLPAQRPIPNKMPDAVGPDEVIDWGTVRTALGLGSVGWSVMAIAMVVLIFVILHALAPKSSFEQSNRDSSLATVQNICEVLLSIGVSFLMFAGLLFGGASRKSGAEIWSMAIKIGTLGLIILSLNARSRGPKDPIIGAEALLAICGICTLFVLCWSMYLYRVAKYLRLVPESRWAIVLLLSSVGIGTLTTYTIGFIEERVPVRFLLFSIPLASLALSIGFAWLHSSIRGGLTEFMLHSMRSRR